MCNKHSVNYAFAGLESIIANRELAHVWLEFRTKYKQYIRIKQSTCSVMVLSEINIRLIRVQTE